MGRPRPNPPPDRPRLLFTAFEPSGDDHASAVIAELRRRYPDLRIDAWGGAKMERAGAVLVERTGDDAVMGLPGLDKLREHQRINRRVEAWLAENPVTVHVPVDSPAANFPICAIAKRSGARVVHLVAPQIWAWGRWRIHKLRRLTDQVLCVLPFEEAFFREHRVPATFIGHPLFDDPLDLRALDAEGADLPRGEPRLALMPGSRPTELRRNFPLLLESFRRLRRDHPTLVGVVAATTPAVEQSLRAAAATLGGWPEGLHSAAGRTDAIVRWCQAAIVVSGTVTLQIARQQRPMVIVYKSSRLMYHAVIRWLLSTEHLTLPNLIAGRRIVPELVPHFEGPEPIVRQAAELLDSPDAAERQRAELGRLVQKFAGLRASSKAAEAIAAMAGLRPPAPGAAG